MNAAKRQQIFERLRDSTPKPTTELVYESVFELLVAVILSAQATDVSVNKATRRLYAVANTPAAIIAMGEDELKRHISTIGQEKARNPRLGGDRTLEDFVKLMGELKLAYPKFIDYALPGNRGCGTCPPGVPEHLQQYCAQIAESRQG